MKFLKNINENVHVMPLNFIYHCPESFKENDAIDIVYKIMETDEVVIETIECPEIEVWIVKPEYRAMIDTPRDYIKMDMLDSYRVRYRYRYNEIAKILNIPKEAVKACQWVLQSNIDIRTFYAIQFGLEYSNDEMKKLNIGVFDIESDTINIDHFPRPGECPTNLISFVDINAKIAWLFILKPNGPARTINPSIGRPYDNRDQIKYLEEHQDEFIAECHNHFDEKYGSDIEYQLVFFDDEMKMTKAFFELLDYSSIDYALAWNISYDMSNLLTRPSSTFNDPREICTSKKFKFKEAYFIADENPVAHKRRHTCQLSHPTTFVDFLVLYAGIRSGKGKPESLRLNFVAKKELEDEKFDFSESASIKTAAYEDFWKFALYSLKDSLLLKALLDKSNDVMDMYERCISNGMLPNEIFTTTIMLTNSITSFFFKEGYVVANNRNKYKTSDIEAYENAMYEVYKDEVPDFDEFLSDDYVEDDLEENSTDDGKASKKKKFEGALVQDPDRMMDSGVYLNGVLSKKLHEFLVDMDLTSLYPTLMIILNLSNDTMIGKIIIPYDMEDFFKIQKNKNYEFSNHKLIGDFDTFVSAENEYKFNRLSLDGYDFINNDKASYRINISDVFAMMVAGKHWSEIGKTFFNLPTFTELDSQIPEEILADILA